MAIASNFTKTVYTLSDFDREKAAAGGLCAVVKRDANLTEITVYTGSATESADHKGVGVCKAFPTNTFKITIKGVTYTFDGSGLPVSTNAATFILKMADSSDAAVIPAGNVIGRNTVVTRSSSGEAQVDEAESNTNIAITGLNARDHFANKALEGIMAQIDNPASLSDSDINYYCEASYQWATYMMSAAAKARAADGESSSDDDIDELTDNTEKLLYKIAEAIENSGSSSSSSQVVTALGNINTTLISAISQSGWNAHIDGTVSIGNSGLGNNNTNPIYVSVSNLEDKQDQLVSGVNIKTVNGSSILGSGNIEIVGEPGTAATVTVGSTTTSTEGSNASVHNSGTSSNAVLDFVIPRGNTGAAGRGVSQISKTGTSDLIDTYTITYTDGTTTTFNVTNGSQGSPGADGDGVEYIYKSFKSEQTFGNDNNNPNYWDVSQSSQYLGPSGYEWNNHPTGIDSTYKWEYISGRNKTNEEWGAYCTPVKWSKWGEKGQDGDGVEYIFRLSTVNPMNTSDYPSDSTTGWEADNYVPINWYGDPVSPTAQAPYCFVSTRKSVNGAWQNNRWTQPKLWSKWSYDGANGSHYEYRFQNNNSTTVSPTKPEAGTDGLSGGWSNTSTLPSTGQYTWMTFCNVSGAGQYGTWENPIRITGEQGDPGEGIKLIPHSEVFEVRTTIGEVNGVPQYNNIVGVVVANIHVRVMEMTGNSFNEVILSQSSNNYSLLIRIYSNDGSVIGEYNYFPEGSSSHIKINEDDGKTFVFYSGANDYVPNVLEILNNIQLSTTDFYELQKTNINKVPNKARIVLYKNSTSNAHGTLVDQRVFSLTFNAGHLFSVTDAALNSVYTNGWTVDGTSYSSVSSIQQTATEISTKVTGITYENGVTKIDGSTIEQTAKSISMKLYYTSGTENLIKSYTFSSISEIFNTNLDISNISSNQPISVSHVDENYWFVNSGSRNISSSLANAIFICDGTSQTLNGITYKSLQVNTRNFDTSWTGSYYIDLNYAFERENLSTEHEYMFSVMIKRNKNTSDAVLNNVFGIGLYNSSEITSYTQSEDGLEKDGEQLTSVDKLIFYKITDENWHHVWIKVKLLSMSNDRDYSCRLRFQGSNDVSTNWNYSIMNPVFMDITNATELNNQLKNTGIDIEQSKITVTTDNFTINNTNDENVLYADSSGNLVVAGTVTASTMYSPFIEITNGTNNYTINPANGSNYALGAIGCTLVLPSPSTYNGLQITIFSSRMTRDGSYNTLSYSDGIYYLEPTSKTLCTSTTSLSIGFNTPLQLISIGRQWHIMKGRFIVNNDLVEI